MAESRRVLLFGATGRSGRLVLAGLLDRGVEVRAILRSASGLPAGTAERRGLTLLEADLASLSQKELLDQLRGCDAVVSCLGHRADLRGIFGPPRDLVSGLTGRVCRAVAELRPPEPLRFLLMGSVSVDHPGGLDARRGPAERAVLALVRALVPPARDNQDSADLLSRGIGQADPFLRWVVVRPDTLLDGEASAYALHEGLVGSLARPDTSTRANVAAFICDLVTEPRLWEAWEGRMPVIVDAALR